MVFHKRAGNLCIPFPAVGALAGGLGTIKGLIRPAVRFIEGEAAPYDSGDADGAALAKMHFPKDLAGLIYDLAGPSGADLPAGGAGQKEHEFIAADSPGDILRAGKLGQHSGKALEQRIPHLMAVEVIDPFEAIQVQQEEEAAGLFLVE